MPASSPVAAGEQQLLVSAALRDRAGTMPADVQEGAQRARVVDHEQALATDLGGEEIAGLGQLRGTADELPGIAEHTLDLACMPIGIRIEARLRRSRTCNADVKLARHGRSRLEIGARIIG